MLEAGPGRAGVRQVRIGTAPAICGGLAMTCLNLCLAGSGGAEAASRSIRLGAYVPVFCALKRVAPYSTVHRGHGPGHGKFKIVCNTPYRMHMEGAWEPLRWPHIPFFSKKHARRGLDVELHVVGDDRSLDGRCALAPDQVGGCHAFKDDDGTIPPRLGQAQVTIDAPRLASRHASRHDADERDRATGEQNSAGTPAPRMPQPWHWQRRMGLGALPRVASASDIPYVPRYFLEASRDDATGDGATGDGATGERAARDATSEDILDRAERQAAESADEHITVYLTLTGRY